MLTANQIKILLKLCEKQVLPVSEARYVIKIEEELQKMLEALPQPTVDVEKPRNEPVEEVPTT